MAPVDQYFLGVIAPIRMQVFIARWVMLSIHRNGQHSWHSGSSISLVLFSQNLFSIAIEIRNHHLSIVRT
jgi:hypothetical protein